MTNKRWHIDGPRYEIDFEDDRYPESLREVFDPPGKLYVIGNPTALTRGLAVIGARKATPYGLTCTNRFAGIAAQKGVTIVSGGARGCDSAAHQALPLSSRYRTQAVFPAPLSPVTIKYFILPPQ